MPQSLGARYLLLQGAGTVYEPVRKHSWEVSISNVGSASQITLAAQSVSPPKYDHESHDIWHMNERTQYAGRGKAKDITIKFLDVFNPNMISLLWTYWQKVYNVMSRQDGPVMGFATNYKSTVSVYQYDISGARVRTWSAYGCWPKGSPASETLDYGGDEALDFTMTLACDYFKMDGIAQ